MSCQSNKQPVQYIYFGDILAQKEKYSVYCAQMSYQQEQAANSNVENDNAERI